MGGFPPQMQTQLLGTMLNMNNPQMSEVGTGGLVVPPNRQLLDYAQVQQALQSNLFNNITRMAEPAGRPPDMLNVCWDYGNMCRNTSSPLTCGARAQAAHRSIANLHFTTSNTCSQGKVE
jgi:hypothetical protein